MCKIIVRVQSRNTKRLTKTCLNVARNLLKNVGSLGFEPRLPTFWTKNSIPQAGILDQARLRPHFTASTPTSQPPNIEQEIIKTIVKCTASGLSNGSLRSICYTLKQLSKGVDSMKPEEVSTHINHANSQETTPTIQRRNKNRNWSTTTSILYRHTV